MNDHAVSQEATRCPTSRFVDDELEAVVGAVCAKYPLHPRSEVETVVRQAYRYLAERATLPTHLVPLTLNRSLRLMRDTERPADDQAVEIRECQADLMAR